MTRLPLPALALLLVPAVCSAEPPDFRKDVAPILERFCVRCHQPGNAKGDVSVAGPDDLVRGNHLVPGKPDDSPLLALVSPRAGGKPPRMPREGKPLSPEDVGVLRAWIAAGAPWPKDAVVQERARASKTWWSLVPLRAAEPPAPDGLPAAWARNPVDRFVFAKLAEKGLAPSPPSDARQLVRRLAFDLTGLPPAPEVVEAFAADPSDARYEKLVDDLLASPAYGEHWGRHWLDVVRFGESNGFERNVLINNAWPFRDYVIASFNADKPVDQLIREHLAGDRLAPGDPAVEVGTAFLVTGPYDNVGNQDPVQAAVIRANTLDEIVRATGEAFLGVTVGCARCHNHKFDPITQQDYYRLTATFAGTLHGERAIVPEAQRREIEATQGRLRAAVAERKAKLKETAASGLTSQYEHERLVFRNEIAEAERELAASAPPTQWWVGRFQAAPGPFAVFRGGDPQKRGDAVPFASPDFLSESARGYTLPETAAEADRRLRLAEWIVAGDNPLTPRVLANRVWGWHFGTGIVDTPSDFGFMGGKPTHPELLDWLARQVQANGWRLKPLHRLIVTSQAYRQASGFRAAAAKVDADARLLWRFPPRRLAGEEVRDAMLAASGTLRKPADEKGGPGFRLYQYQEDNVATYVPLDRPGPETYRRAVYHQNARAARVDVLSDFDCPDPAFACPRRASTTTPMQALALFNHPFTLDIATALARRVAAEAGESPSAQVDRLFVLTLGRPPRPAEAGAVGQLAARHGLRAACRALLNANEFLYLD